MCADEDAVRLFGSAKDCLHVLEIRVRFGKDCRSGSLKPTRPQLPFDVIYRGREAARLACTSSADRARECLYVTAEPLTSAGLGFCRAESVAA